MTHPDADMHWTEGGPDYASPDYATDWAKWEHTFTGALRNWRRSITGWNLALDEHRRPTSVRFRVMVWSRFILKPRKSRAAGSIGPSLTFPARLAAVPSDSGKD